VIDVVTSVVARTVRPQRIEILEALDSERPLCANNSHWARILPLPEVLLTDQSKKANHGHGKAKRI
jgi:hypothetical protein